MILRRMGMPGLAAIVILLAGLTALSCCSRCADCLTKDDGAARTGGGGEANGGDDGSPTTLQRNLSDAEILVERVETSATGYILTGRVLSVRPVGSSASIAEEGQTLSLQPFYPGGTPDGADPAHLRMMELPSKKPGETIRCRIARDGRGSWRIVSAE